jgi:hypothetical protein
MAVMTQQARVVRPANRADAAEDREGAQIGPRIPFPRASHQYAQGTFLDQTKTPGAAAQDYNVGFVTPRGYLRHLWLLFTGANGVIGGGALDADYPYSLIDRIRLTDPGGTDILSPLDGFSLMLVNLFGSYVRNPDPAAVPSFVGTINPNFSLRVPVEIVERTGLGSIANQDANAQYQLAVTLAASTGAFDTPPGTNPDIRLRGYVEGWIQPEPFDQFGNPQEIEPPAHGTTQYWRIQTVEIASAGENVVKFTHTGNLIRELIVIGRTAAGARSDTVLPDPARFIWDNREQEVVPLQYRRTRLFEQLGRAIPTGTMAYSFAHDNGRLGNELGQLYLPTVSGSLLEMRGNFAAAGRLTVLTNELAPVGAPVRPEEG